MMDLRELYQEVVLDHGQHPRNFGPLSTANLHQEGFNPLCGDKVILHIHKENEWLKAVHFEGSGCAISMASASLLTESIQNKTVDEFNRLFEDFHQLVTGGEGTERLGKLTVLAGVSEFPARVKCATLAWHALKTALKNQVSHPVTFTPAGRSHIQNMLQKNKNSIGFRLSIKKTGCSGLAYVPEVIEVPYPKDTHWVSEGLNVYLDPLCETWVKGLVIDYVADPALGPLQKRLVFINPNEKNRCGCGESFTIE